MTIRNLDALFKPDTVALICGGGGGGGGEEIIARNLMSSGFKGPIMPVDAKRNALAGAVTYRDIASLPPTARRWGRRSWTRPSRTCCGCWVPAPRVSTSPVPASTSA